MSKVSDIYTNLCTLVESTLSTYTKIPNPYDPEINASLLLAKGYGCAFGPASNTERFASCKLSVQRSFSIILINQVTTTDHNTTARNVIEKSIMEDLFSLINAVETDTDLNSQTVKAIWTDDSGIEYLLADRAKYFSVVGNFECEYIENLS